MITLKETDAILITKEDFCKGVKISKDNWIFNKVGKNSRFWMYPYHDSENPDRYYFDNDLNSIMEFKYMKKYDETWIRKFEYIKTNEGKKGQWSLWNTWKVW